jgi:hypothetical protein
MTSPSPPCWGRGKGEGERANVKGINAFVLEINTNKSRRD